MNSKFFYGHMDALFYSLMVGAGEAFFAAFSIDLGYSELQASIIVTVPIFIGGLLQLVAPFGINKIRSYKNWTMAGVTLQSLIFLVFILTRSELSSNFFLLFTLVSLYWTMSLGVGPSWNSWVSSFLQTGEIRRYFSERSIFGAIGTLSGLLMTGLTLQYGPKVILGLDRYDFIFLVCALFRLTSLFALGQYPRVEFKEVLQEFDVHPPKNDFLKKFILYSCLFKIGVFFSASFFVPYMFKQLHLSYIQFTVVLLSPFLGRVLFNKFFRKTIENYNINNVYLYASIGISLIPVLWIFVSAFAFLFFMEIFTGMLWGAFEVAFNITCFEKIPTERQSKIMAKYNLMHTACIGIGSLSGIFTFSRLELGPHAYHIIFGVSAFLRAVALVTFPREEIESTNVDATLISRPMAVRPNMGFISRPVWKVFRKIKK